jgi:hypothetical protein
VPFSAPLMKSLRPCRTFLRSPGLVMIEDEYCIGSQMPQ